MCTGNMSKPGTCPDNAVTIEARKVRCYRELCTDSNKDGVKVLKKIFDGDIAANRGAEAETYSQAFKHSTAV
jgi:hypothetical protein